MPKFNYPTVKKEFTKEGSRVYFIEHENQLYQGLYSVTTILSKMKDKTEIEKWKNRIGHDEANKILEKSVNIGNRMHDILYHRMTNQVYNGPYKNNFLFQLAERLADSIYEEGLYKLTELWGAEVPLFVPNYYAGRTDCVGIYDNKPSIIDFKNAYKDKKIEYMEDYFVQGAAYAVAHDYLFKTNIEQIVILIANSSDGSAKEVIRKDDEFKEYKNKWLDILENFFNK